MNSKSKRRVAYFYNEEASTFFFQKGSPFNSWRAALAHNLMMEYGLLKHVDFHLTPKATSADLMRFHSPDYIKSLERLPNTGYKKSKFMNDFNIDVDTLIMDGLYYFLQLAAGGSLAAATAIASKKADIAINWIGGMHHAKKRGASGYCFVNDCVLAVMKLLDTFDRVMYLNVSAHHCDAVEEAFYYTDRVLVLSFHKLFAFPGTGILEEIGRGRGKFYNVNVPLETGVDDVQYEQVFNEVFDKVVDWFKPMAIVVNCGPDSVGGDCTESFNLTTEMHGKCIHHVIDKNIPLVLLGGPCLSPKNTSICWTLAMAAALGQELSPIIPTHEFIHHYAPEYSLNPIIPKLENGNTTESIKKTLDVINARLFHLPFAPCVYLEEGILIPMEETSDSDIDDDESIEFYMENPMSDTLL